MGLHACVSWRAKGHEERVWEKARESSIRRVRVPDIDGEKSGETWTICGEIEMQHKLSK